MRNPSGDLLFTYRDGKSGSGDQIWNIYDEKTRGWRRLLDQPLTDGQGRMNAYFQGPTLGPDGYYHLIWTWRDTPDCATNHDLSYARSRDLVHWESSAGKLFTLPIRVEQAEIIDPVPVRGGLLNGNTRIGFDSKGRVVATYHKYDSRGFLQIMAARRDPSGWTIRQVSDWDYRWEFSGGGSIVLEITHGAVSRAGNGKLRLDYKHPKRGSGAWLLDEETLKAVGAAPAARSWPAELTKVESAFPGMQVNVRPDSGRAPSGKRYVLRWETLGANRDRPRTGPLPDPSMLRVHEVK
jgi:hypothetical protein